MIEEEKEVMKKALSGMMGFFTDKHTKWQGSRRRAGLYYYGARYYDAVTSIMLTVDGFAEKYPDLSPYQYGANNPLKYIDVNGDSLDVSFYDRNNQRMNSVPDPVQKMFNEEYGISVGYNNKTGMLYYAGEVETENTVSESAKGIIMSALTDQVGGQEATDKYGEIVFGYGRNFGRRHPPKQVDAGASNGQIAWIDLKDFRRDGSLNLDYSGLDASGISRRTFNLGRVFEHEWIAHVLNKAGDGFFQSIRPGGAVEIVNQFRTEMGLPQRLNYGGNLGIFFGNDRSAFKGMRRAVRKGGVAPRVN